MNRRQMLQTSGLGFGTLALTYLLGADGMLEAGPAPAAGGADLLPRPSHFAPRARAVIMLMQNGGPSQMDLFDPKPELARQAGKTMTVETFQLGNSDKLMASPLTFRRYGRSGTEMAAILPHLGSLADDVCLVR